MSKNRHTTAGAAGRIWMKGCVKNLNILRRTRTFFYALIVYALFPMNAKKIFQGLRGLGLTFLVSKIFKGTANLYIILYKEKFFTHIFYV